MRPHHGKDRYESARQHHAAAGTIGSQGGTSADDHRRRAYNVIMASITLFMFTSWFKGQAYDLLEHNGLLKTDYSAVDNASTVVGIYALLVLIIGIVSFIMSMRCLAPGTTSRWVIIWLAIVVVFSLGTMDLIGLALYSITLVIYLARNKAIAAQQDVIRTWARTHQG